MRAAGIILVIAGILMFLFRGIHVQTKKKVLDAGPIEISRKENKQLNWPGYAGAVAVAGGLVLLLVSGRKK